MYNTTFLNRQRVVVYTYTLFIAVSNPITKNYAHTILHAYKGSTYI